MDFEIGDRVVTNKRFGQDGVTFEKGTIGKVISNSSCMIGVQWNFKHSLFHKCGSRGEDGYCFYVPNRYLNILDKKKNNIEGW